jgi:hypothetical protein
VSAECPEYPLSIWVLKASLLLMLAERDELMSMLPNAFVINENGSDVSVAAGVAAKVCPPRAD